MDRCALCPGTNQCVQGDGPLDSDIYCLAEAPGKDENKPAPRGGRPLVGKTGDEVNNHYLQLAGIRREMIRVDNSISCLPTSSGGKLDPNSKRDQALLECCAKHHVYPHLERFRPDFIIPMGRFACDAIDPTIDLELMHGTPVQTKWGEVFPMYHPSLGIHEPKKMLYIRSDWIRAKAWLRGQYVKPVDPYPNPDYREVLDADEMDELDPTLPMGCDTEFDKHRNPYCLTYSNQMGTGRLIRAERTDLLERFQQWLERWRAPILFHNWFADAPIVAAMGLTFPPARLVDTMVAVFHLGNLPQGLKAIAYRELGMRMRDFDDVVRPHSTDRVLDYYMKAASFAWPKPEETMVRGDDMKWKPYKPQGMNTKLKRFFTDFSKSDGEKDVFKTWENWEDNHAMIEAELGEWPGLDISHAPFEDVLPYACADSDGTLRLWNLILHMRRLVRKWEQNRWTEGWAV